MIPATPIRAKPRRMCTYKTPPNRLPISHSVSALARPPRICTFHSYFKLCVFNPVSPRRTYLFQFLHLQKEREPSSPADARRFCFPPHLSRSTSHSMSNLFGMNVYVMSGGEGASSPVRRGWIAPSIPAVSSTPRPLPSVSSPANGHSGPSGPLATSLRRHLRPSHHLRPYAVGRCGRIIGN